MVVGRIAQRLAGIGLSSAQYQQSPLLGIGMPSAKRRDEAVNVLVDGILDTLHFALVPAQLGWRGTILALLAEHSRHC